MAHGSNVISSIKLPNGTTYEIHDKQAIHTLADIEGLGLEGAFIYKGTVAKVSDLPVTGNKVGDVYHVTENDNEYVWISSNEWEEFGHHMTVEHTHNITSVAGTNASSTVSGSATVTGTNKASSVTGSGTVAVPTVSETAKYAKVSINSSNFVTSYPGVNSKMVTTSIKPAGAAVEVINSVTPSTGSVTGVSGSTTASKATAGTAVAVAKAGTAVTVATRAADQTTVATGLTGGKVTAGSAANWSASVDEDGVLSFSFSANTPTSVTLPTASTTKIYGCGGTASITPAVSVGSITPYTFEDITVPVAATEATTVVTNVATDKTSVATVGTGVTVATGALNSTGTGASVLTGLGIAATAKALTRAYLADGTASDYHTGDVVTIGNENKTVNITGTAAAQEWTQASGTISGTAAAQKWKFSSGATGNPV